MSALSKRRYVAALQEIQENETIPKVGRLTAKPDAAKPDRPCRLGSLRQLAAVA